jgi:hypothetical protein
MNIPTYKGYANKTLLAILAALTLTLGLASQSHAAEFKIEEVGGALTDAGGFSRQAGAHPDLTTELHFSSTHSGFFDIPDGAGAHSVQVDLPPGLVGNPTAAPTCSTTLLVAGSQHLRDMCPTASQVGIALLNLSNAHGLPTEVGVYNIERPDNLPALFAFNYFGVVVRIEPSVRAGDYGITAKVNNISQAERLFGSRLTLWGVPADPSHDADRFFVSYEFSIRGASTLTPRKPFLTSPTSCSGEPLVTTIKADSWESPGVFSTVSFDSDFDGTPFTIEGCDRLGFAPAIAVQPQSHRADSPTGLDFDLTIPQNQDPDGLASAQMRKAVVTFPQGMSVSPASAAGLGACSPAQIDLASTAAPSCPDSSKIGTISLDTPLLDEPLKGDVILASQNDNPFHSLLALYLVVKGPGIVLKIPGRVDPDPVTGQLTATFDNSPQAPFGHLRVTLNGGPRAALVTPKACGTYTTHAALTSWASSVPVVLDTPMTIDEGCDTGAFNPGLKAATSNPVAGGFSPFTLQVTRNDGEQNVSRIEATLPEGLLAKLAGVPLCGDAQAATGDCPAGSQVGQVTVGAGSGSNPLYVPEAGKAPTAVYLAGPYKGAPYSMVVKVPAQAGPFDLGAVTVRNGLYIDPTTAQATAKSDPLPQILQGIPIAYRDVRVEINRPEFILNPTSCDPMKISSTLTSSNGKTASPSARFQVGGCGDLGFKPKLALKFSGPTHRSAHPKLKATLTMPKDGANIGKAVVTLPKTEFLENAHIRTICTRVQYAANQCPKGSVYGYAKAWTPLLDKPLQGPVYLRSSNHTLPDLVASLDGAIHVDLAGRIDSPGGKIRNTFWAVPDAPVSKFVLTMQGGDKGLLVNNTELCKAKPHAKAEFTGQNGKLSVSSPLVKTDCGKSSRKR